MSVKPYPESTPADRAFIGNFEGRINFIYDDAISPPRKYIKGQAIKGNLTGGVGHLISRHNQIVDPDAYNTFLGKTIPANIVDSWLDDDLNAAEAQVARSITVPITSHQRGALISICENIGEGAFAGSTLVKDVNGKNWKAIPADFGMWKKTDVIKNGVKILVTSNGLVSRRAAEAAYFFTKDGVQPVVAPSVPAKAPVATEIAQPATTPTSPFEWASLAIGGVTGSSAFATAEGAVGIAIAVAICVAVVIGAVIVIKRQFFKG